MIETTVEEKVSIIDKITDNIIAILMTVGVLYMAVMGIDVPNWLAAIYGAIITFYFKK